MDVQQVKAFLAVAEELHFGRAAERLHVAQPPLSRTIKQLEHQLGTRLFDRNTRSVRLTASGEALVAPAKEVLAAFAAPRSRCNRQTTERPESCGSHSPVCRRIRTSPGWRAPCVLSDHASSSSCPARTSRSRR